jgi:hypothetical protein
MNTSPRLLISIWDKYFLTKEMEVSNEKETVLY